VTRRGLSGALVALLFVLLATANSGGYRYGIADQAFYVPAIAQRLDPSLFPRDAPVLHVQTRLWLGDELAAGVIGATGLTLPQLAAVGYLAGLLLLGGGVVSLARALGASWPAALVALSLLTLRHRIARTGANSLEGYFHPRMIAFAIGVWALTCVVRGRIALALACVAAAAIVHTTTGFWFAAAVVLAVAWRQDRRSLWLVAAAGSVVLAWLALRGQRMDALWLSAFAAKDYLFPGDWPWWAWCLNLSYPAALVALYRRRAAIAVARGAESSLVAALVLLALAFLIAVPLTSAGIALVVQAQVSRVFWVLDVLALVLLAWWVTDDIAARLPRGRVVLVVFVVLVSAARGLYVIAGNPDRHLVEWTLPSDAWTDVMTWVGAQPSDLGVLADPAHAWRYGSSVRVASAHDTVLEEVKDSALAIYDRAVAERVVERSRALAGFDALTENDLIDASRRFGAALLVLPRSRPLSLPVLYENSEFVVYDAR
jgi:hypothetical protein